MLESESREPLPPELRRQGRGPVEAQEDVEPWVGAVAIFFGTAMFVVVAVAAAARAAEVSLTSPDGFVYILVAMWGPTLGRVAARLTVDRGKPAPMGLFGSGRPAIATLGLPLAATCAVYGVAYASATAMGETAWGGPWADTGRVLVNVGFNLPAAMLLGLPGAIGEELGWRGWLQPRLDRAGIRGSLPIVILLETVWHIPLILAIGYSSDSGPITGILLFGLLKLGATPLWTWTQYRQRTVWAPIWFHAAHNAVAQAIVPKMFIVVGPAWMVGEVGVLPIIAYLGGTLCVLGLLWWRGGSWSSFARWSLDDR